MPDVWENNNGLNPNSSADGNQDRNGDGYTNIEEYINGLAAELVGQVPPAPRKQPKPPTDLAAEDGG